MGIINVQNTSKMNANDKCKSTCPRIIYDPCLGQKNIIAPAVHYAQKQTQI